jgi:hypothetical protein
MLVAGFCDLWVHLGKCLGLGNSTIEFCGQFTLISSYIPRQQNPEPLKYLSEAEKGLDAGLSKTSSLITTRL